MVGHSKNSAKDTTSAIGRRRLAALRDGSEAYAAKRRELVQVAATIFKEKGYEGVALHDIAKAFGTNRASLYYYVTGKEELFREAVIGVVQENVEIAERVLLLSEDPPRKLELLVERLTVSYEDNYPYMYVYIQEDMRKVAHEDSKWATQMARQTRRFETIVVSVIKEGIDGGFFRDDISSDLAANALFGMVNWTHRWFKPGRKLTAAQMADGFCKIFLDGMRR